MLFACTANKQAFENDSEHFLGNGGRVVKTLKHKETLASSLSDEQRTTDYFCTWA